MKRLLPFVLTAAAAGGAGWFAARHHHESWDQGKAERHVQFYQSPMHPWVKSDQPGQCTVCGMDLVPVYQGDAGFDHVDANLVLLPEGSPNVVGVQTVVVSKQPLVKTLRVSGTICEDESRHGIVSAPVEGRLDGLAMSCEGQMITKRQPLATMFSRTLLSAANDYKLALAQGEEAAAPARRRLEQCGLVWEQIKSIPTRQPDDPYFGVLAPMSGTIVKSYVAEGQYVREGDKLFEIADFSKMWFVFAAAEADLPLLKPGQVVTMRAPSLTGQTLKARISFVSPNLDETTRTAQVRVVLENPERRLRNRMFAEGTVELEAPEVVAIPRSAVLWSGGQPRVYVAKSDSCFQRRAITLGQPGDALWEITEGLVEGQRVVVSGGMLIDSQAQLNDFGRPETK